MLRKKYNYDGWTAAVHAVYSTWSRSKIHYIRNCAKQLNQHDKRSLEICRPERGSRAVFPKKRRWSIIARGIYANLLLIGGAHTVCIHATKALAGTVPCADLSWCSSSQEKSNDGKSFKTRLQIMGNIQGKAPKFYCRVTLTNYGLHSA